MFILFPLPKDAQTIKTRKTYLVEITQQFLLKMRQMCSADWRIFLWHHRVKWHWSVMPQVNTLFSFYFRPRRAQSDLTAAFSLPKLEEDPCMMTSLAEKMFPQLSLESKQTTGPNTSLSCVAVHDGDKSVQLPSLNVEQNYSQMLSEIVAHFWRFTRKVITYWGIILLCLLHTELLCGPLLQLKESLGNHFIKILVPVLLDVYMRCNIVSSLIMSVKSFLHGSH